MNIGRWSSWKMLASLSVVVLMAGGCGNSSDPQGGYTPPKGNLGTPQTGTPDNPGNPNTGAPENGGDREQPDNPVDTNPNPPANGGDSDTDVTDVFPGQTINIGYINYMCTVDGLFISGGIMIGSGRYTVNGETYKCHKDPRVVSGENNNSVVGDFKEWIRRFYLIGTAPAENGRAVIEKDQNITIHSEWSGAESGSEIGYTIEDDTHLTTANLKTIVFSTNDSRGVDEFSCRYLGGLKMECDAGSGRLLMMDFSKNFTQTPSFPFDTELRLFVCPSDHKDLAQCNYSVIPLHFVE